MSTKATKKDIVLVQGVVDAKLFDRFKSNKIKEVFVMEGRPSLEAARTLSKELLKRKITPVIISDNMAGFLFFKGMVKEVWLACQVPDSDGAICDIGALILAVLGKKHNVPVHLFAAGRKTRFLGKPSDIGKFMNKQVAPKGIKGYVPLVEWVPDEYISKI